MIHGSAQVRPRYVPASTAEGKWAASSSGVMPGLRSRIQPARANSGTQMQSSIMTSKPGWPPSRLMTRNWRCSSEVQGSTSALTRMPGCADSNSARRAGIGAAGPRILACLRTRVSGAWRLGPLPQPISAIRHAARRRTTRTAPSLCPLPRNGGEGFKEVLARWRGTLRSSREGGEQAIDALGEAALDLVSTGAVAVLALLERIVDVAFLARELLEREDRPPVRFLVAGQHLLLLLGHGHDQVGFGNHLAVAPQIRRDDRVLAEMDTVFAQHDARVERGNHPVARMVGDPPRAHEHAPARVALILHPLEQDLRHHAAAGIGVTDEEDGPHRRSEGDCQKRMPPGSVFHSAFGRSSKPLPKLVPIGSCRSRPSVSGKSLTSSSGSIRRSASSRRIGWGGAMRA